LLDFHEDVTHECYSNPSINAPKRIFENVHLGLLLLLILGVVKLLMTTVIMAGGFVGGIFAPTLFVGTMLGGAYGQIMQATIGGREGNPQVYAIAGWPP